MKKRTHVQHKGSSAIRSRAYERRPHGGIRWLISAAICCAAFICTIGIVNAAQNSGPTLAQKMQGYQQLLQVGRAHARSKPIGKNLAPAVQPAPVRHAGIVAMGQGPFSPTIFEVDTLWQGPVGEDWVLAYVGVKMNANGTAGPGGIVLYTEAVNKLGGFDVNPLGTFLAPNGTTALAATGWNGNLLLLRDRAGTQLTFNLITHQFQ